MSQRLIGLPRVFLAAVLAMFVFAPGLPQRAAAQGGASAANQYVLVDASDRAARSWAAAAGGQALLDYGSFSLWRLPAAGGTALSGAPAGLRPAGGRIYLRGYTLDTTQPAAEPVLPESLRQGAPAGEGLWLVQFIGPALDTWLDALRAAGLQIVGYLPENAYLVWGDDAQARIVGSDALAGLVLWQGAYHPAYRLAPELRQAALDGAPGSLEVTIQVVDTPRLAATLAQLAGMADAQLAPAEAVLNLTNLRLRLPAARLAQAAALADIYNIEPYSPPQLLDEIQGQVLAGNTSSVGGKTVAGGPGYLAWLDGKGFPSDPAAYPLVDVIDDGIDTGDPTNVQHPDFYQLGVKPGSDRIDYITNCTIDFTGNGGGGHGNLNAGILAGYNDQVGFPFENAEGYQYGLGISPYGRIGGTKIFSNTGGLDVSKCGGSDIVVIQNSYQQGARLSSDSWGGWTNGVYNADAQVYDMLTRDASAAVGNQEMLHVFAAGNDGSFVGAINSPASAKNVLAVGATENPRDPGISCNGWTEADSADDIASYSSRGPTADGRAKPDLVAPGTHVQGPATQDPEYNHGYVCGAYYPGGQTLYTWSTGTSHSTPAVAGAAQLAYEYYGRVLAPGKTPSPAMLKGLLINSPRYLSGTAAGGTLPGVAQGWGMLDMGRLFDDAQRTLLDQDILFSDPGESMSIDGAVSDPALPLRISLVWSDAPGATGAGRALVNDLDLEVSVGGQVYKGNVFSGSDSVAGGAADDLNNVENVFIPAGASGVFNVRVVARSLGGDGVPGNADTTDQDFALVIYNGTGNLAPSLSIQGLRWFPVNANLNPYPEPGETLDLEVDLANSQGAAPALDVQATLVVTAGLASVTQADAVYGNLLGGHMLTNPTRFRVAIDAGQACGGVLGLQLMINYQGGSAILELPDIQTALPGGGVQSFSSSGAPAPIPDEDPGGALMPVTVSSSAITRGLTVTVDISHTFIGDLQLSLVSPWGDTVLLADRRGGGEANYAGISFDDSAPRAIATSPSPFAGSYQPEQALGPLARRSAAGIWMLKVVDASRFDVGTINAFAVNIEASGCTVAQYFYPWVDSFISAAPLQ